MAYVRKDHFHKKAKQDGFRSRAAYKLQELNKRFKLFRQGYRILDLGAAPGGWLQVAAREVGKNGRVVGIDLLPIEPIHYKQVTFILGDLLDQEVRVAAIEAMGGFANTVLSDMAPNISGVKITDCARSFELCMLALEIARETLRPGGALVVKIFPGEDFEAFLKEMKASFSKVKTTKPEATRKTSHEVYVIGTGFRGDE